MSRGRGYESEVANVLAEAARCYRARDSVSCLEKLAAAAELAPQRLDIRTGLANYHIQSGLVDKAIEIYANLITDFPYDIGTRIRLAHWRRYKGETDGVELMLGELRERSPERAVFLAAVWSAIDQWESRPLGGWPENESDDLPGGKRAIAVLGYRLNEDGGILPPLADRLKKTMAALARYPDAVLLASGGVPQAGLTETEVMSDWFIGQGVDAGKILQEGHSRDLVENLLFIRHTLEYNRISRLLIVTSADNLRRAGAGMDIVDMVVGPFFERIEVVASDASLAAFTDDGRDRLKLYRDVLRAGGVPMMEIFPELVER